VRVVIGMRSRCMSVKSLLTDTNGVAGVVVSFRVDIELVLGDRVLGVSKLKDEPIARQGEIKISQRAGVLDATNDPDDGQMSKHLALHLLGRLHPADAIPRVRLTLAIVVKDGTENS